jgi:tetratricopeptide (TPR) repeat protein
MRLTILILLAALVVRAVVWFWAHKGHRQIARGMRMISAINAIMAAYREGDYEAGLQKAEALKDPFKPLSKSAEYCFFRGTLLHHLGRLDEAEASLREGLPLEEDPRQRALVHNTLATVLMDAGRYPEAIAFFENAGTAWPDRGSSHRGIAEVWLRQGREFPEALSQARQAVDIDRAASGMKKEALHSRLGEDLATLAWAVAANASAIFSSTNPGAVSEVELLLAESFQLCGTKTKPVLAQIHYQAGKAYKALKMSEKAQENFRLAAAADPRGVYGRLAQATSV